VSVSANGTAPEIVPGIATVTANGIGEGHAPVANERMIEDTKGRMIEDTNEEMIEDTNERTIKEMIEGTNDRMIEDTNEGMTGDANERMIEDTDSRAWIYRHHGSVPCYSEGGSGRTQQARGLECDWDLERDR